MIAFHLFQMFIGAALLWFVVRPIKPGPVWAGANLALGLLNLWLALEGLLR